MFAEVAVRTPIARRLQTGDEAAPAADLAAPLGMTFHYAVPPDLAGRVQPGHLVWAPFGKQRLQGVVLDLVEQLPAGVERARPLIGLVMPEPVCTPAQLALARWLSSHYLAPILDCVLLMLPPGLAQRAEPVLLLTPSTRRTLAQPPPVAASAPPQPQQMALPAAEFEAVRPGGPYVPHFPDLKPEQHALIALLQARDLISLRVLKRKHPELARRSVFKPLIERELVARQHRIVEPPPRPKTGKQVTLLANEATIERALPTLGRSSKQADVLAWLAASADPLPTVAAVCEAVGCSPAPLRSLAERGWVQISPERRWLDLLLSPAQVGAALADDLSRAPAQAAALAALQAAAVAGPVDEDAWRAEHNVTTGALAALEQRGFLRRLIEEPAVALLLPRDETPERLIELRGAEKYRSVLEALAGEEGPVWVGWLYAEADTDLATLRELAEAGLIGLSEEEIWRDPLAGKEFVADQAPPLTNDQARVWSEIERSLRKPTPGEEPVFLLHGVTGSGKTEIYLRAIEATLKAGKQALALVPEIALTPQTVRRFAARFGDRVTVTHSELSAGERYDVWRSARAGDVDVVVGARSALFLPLPRLGLIVLDEEHDSSYKEGQRAPRYHARAAALQLARLTGAVVILGSATPALESYYAARLGQMRLLELPRRIMGHARTIAEQQRRLLLRQTVYRPLEEADSWSAREARYVDLPRVQVIDLRQELRAGNRSIFSRALQGALDDVLKAGQQAILFLNRRGSATFVMCRDCGHVLSCERCDVPFTYHESGKDAHRTGKDVARRRPAEIVCHHCSQRIRSPERCPSCSSRRIRYLGAGTERVADLVRTLWPAAQVVRWDRDVTGRKGSHDAILSHFVNQQANVMVGTQMIAKGLDLPLVTLVGVISADVGLYLPDFRAAERSFQLLTQVAGRAGRSLLGGRVIVQSYRPEHYAIQAARRHDYVDFFAQELNFRRQVGYPPFRRLARLVFVHSSQERVQAEAEALARGLRFAIHEGGRQGIDLIGPAPCFFGRERGKHRWQIIVRAADPAAFLRTIALPQGWRVDVDPLDLL